MMQCLRPLWEVAPHFGGGSSTPSTSTTSSSSAPWTGQQPYLTGSGTPGQPGSINGIFPAAANLYNNTAGYPQYYPNSTYSPLTQGQQQFIQGAGNYGASLGNSGINAANSSLTSMLSPGYTSQTQPGFNASQNYLTGMVNGDTLNPFSAPGFQNVVNSTLANVLPATSASFINGGRSDSGLAQAAQTAASTNAVGGLANQNYVQEQGLQQGAANIASTNALTQQGNQLKGAAVAPSIDQSQLGDLNAGLSAAGMEQGNNQNTLNDLVARWNYGQTLPFNMLGQYQNYVGGTGYGGTTTGQSTTPYYSNTGANLLSGASGGAALGSLLGTAFPQTIGGLGAAGGGGLGALLALSDRRLKTDIRKVGESDSGFPMFSFRYKWDEPGTKHIGVMAQDVMKTRPEAVTRTPFGLAVDYEKALAA